MIALCLLGSLFFVPTAPLEGPCTFVFGPGRAESRPLAELDADLAAAGVLRVRFDAAPVQVPAGADRAQATLLNGDIVYGKLVGGEGDDFQLRLISGIDYELRVDDVFSLELPQRVPDSWPDPLEPGEDGDRLYRRQGAGLDRLDGTVEDLSSEGVRFYSVLGSRVFPWNEVCALFIDVLDEEVSGTPPDRTGRVVIDLQDGSRLRGRLDALNAAGARLELDGGGRMDLPLAILAEISRDDGSVGFLSEYTRDLVRADEGSPFGDDLGMRWPYRNDRAVDGSALKAGGHIYPRGIGVHAPSRLSFPLNMMREWRSLSGQVAIDDQVMRLAARGSVVFRVHVDGELRWESAVLRGGDAPLDMPTIDLEGAEELVLEVGEASDSFVADRADWLELMLTK